MNVRFPSLRALRRGGRQLAALAGTTVIESIQQPAALLMLLTAVGTTLLVPVFQFHRFGEDGRLARDSGLSCMLVFGMALAVSSAGHAVAGDLARGTAAAALGKPVARPLFLLAKWAGVLGVVTLFWCAQLAATLLAERASAHFLIRGDTAGYASDPITLLLALAGLAAALFTAAARHAVLRRRFGVSAFLGVPVSQGIVVLISGFYNRFGQLYPVFGEAACEGCGGAHAHEPAQVWLYHAELNPRVIPAALLLLFALAVFAALAVALATRLPTGSVLAVCAMALLLGLAGDALFADAARFSARGLLAGVLPDLQHFWLCDRIARGGRVPGRYVAEAGLYALTCCALFLTAGGAAFRNRDLG
ncbi:MAG: hypothetical protein RBT78_07250 [Kiritimatiellia bacterium]|jgi:hypothetical protein|nr:hypothetical protein [Kiritimatiellia bacterium]